MSECPACGSEDYSSISLECPDCGEYDESFHHGSLARRREEEYRRIEEGGW